jgi:hypothetical protein
MSDLNAVCFRMQKDINERKSIILVCRCRIEYWGRSRSVVGLGDRLVLVKPDSTLIVHSLSGFKPLNWMSSPADIVAELEGNLIVVHSQRTVSPYEEMRIAVESVHDYRSYHGLEDREELELTHTERDMQDYLVKNPHLIDENFRLKSTGYRSPLGFFDIYGRIGERYAVVELKSERAGLPAVLQLKRYRDWLSGHLKDVVVGMLMAPSITPNALSLMRREKLTYRKFSLRQIKRPARQAKGTLGAWIYD